MTSTIEQGRTPEREDILLMDASMLMQHNPAALVANKESYERIAGGFDPDLFQLPYIVKVRTFLSEDREVIRYLIVDGMTRTKFVADNQEEIVRKHPDFRFRVKDVTTAYLRNPRVVPSEEITEEQQALTMSQYLDFVVPYTAEHSQIVVDRIAAHLINGWNNMVGPDMGRKYSALVALSLLTNPTINIATEEGLKRDLDRQPRLMENETKNERDRLSQSLSEMAAVIRKSRIPNRQEVMRSAFMLVGTDSPVIGGELEARGQIYGLLHIPEVEKKMTEAYVTIGEREQMRDQVGQFLVESFRRARRGPNMQEVLNALGEALRNPLLNYDHTLNVITSQNPPQRYIEVRQEVNKDRLTRVYVTSDRTGELSSLESQLIEKFGRTTNLSDTDIQRLTEAIQATDIVLERTEELKTQITTNRDQLLEQGVSRQFLDEAMSNMQRYRQGVDDAGSLQTLNNIKQRLDQTLNEITRRMNNQIKLYRIGGMVDEAGGDRLKEGFGPRARNDIRDLVFGEFVEITEQNQAQVQQRIQELLSLGDDLLSRVKEGEISFERALDIQRGRSGQVSTKPTVPPTTSPTTIDRVPTVGARIPTIKPPVIPPHEETIIDARQLGERRKQVNREKFNRFADNFYAQLINEIDLEPKDITDTERRRIDSLAGILGRLGYDWSDAARILREEHRRVLAENRILREELLGRQREYTDRDTRTRR